jgi:hypothetical protein
MNVTELLPQLHRLSKLEKVKIIQFLVQDLESENLEQDNVLLHLSGTWTAEDEAEFLDHTSPFRMVEEKLWN